MVHELKFDFCLICIRKNCGECINGENFSRACTCGSGEPWETCSAPFGWSECG